MDLIKIGKFIAEQRKNKKLTQEELAEKLLVTDRAVSKWERGLSLIDAGKMLDLCNILDINVNELLNGEKIDMKDYNKKTEELLVELAKKEEEKNKKLMMNMWVLLISSVIFFLGIATLANCFIPEGKLQTIIVVADTIVFILVCLYAGTLEYKAGYYECNNCHHRFVPKSYTIFLAAPHIHTTRFMKCPNCGKRGWSKKVMSKE